MSIALFIVAKTWKQPKSIKEWMDKENVWYLYTQWNIIYPLKMIKILPFSTTWIDLEDIMLSEISQTKTKTVRSHLYVEYFLKNQTYRNREQIGGFQKWREGTGRNE